MKWVELRGGGWPSPIGHVQNAIEVRQTAYPSHHTGLRYARIDLDALIFHHAPAVLVMQGMKLQDFFPPDVYFIDDKDHVLARGPFILLKGDLSKAWDPPLRLQNVVLAALEHVPEGMSREEVLSRLLKEVI